MSEGLCWKCEDHLALKMKYWREKGEEEIAITLGEVAEFLSCHHEPKEKPKCWCEVNRSGLYTVLNNITIRVNFCPQCGKKLGD